MTIFVRRKRYSVAGWKWLERAAIGHKNLMELAELTHILLKTKRMSEGSSTMKKCSECYMDGNCIYQANNDMCPLGVNPKRRGKRNHELSLLWK